MTQPLEDDLATAPEDDDPTAQTGEPVEEDTASGEVYSDLVRPLREEVSPLRIGLSEPLEARYRLCVAGVELREEISKQHPNRDRTSDGWIGDTAHSRRRSDHNPNSAGVVRAIDVDKDGLPANALVEHLRAIGASGDRRLLGGYLIWNARIAGTHTRWRWHRYRGSNPHTMHFHVSFADAASDYETSGPWGVLVVRRFDRHLGYTNPRMSGHDVANVQRALNKYGLGTVIDGIYSRETADDVHVFQTREGIRERGVGTQTWKALRAVAHGR